MSFFRYFLLLPCLFIFAPSFAAASEKWQSPENVEGTETVSLAEAIVLHARGIKFIDVRSPRQFKKRHIQGAIHLYINNDFSEQNLLKHVKKNESFIIYCNGVHCSLSYKAAEKAVAWGFTGIKYFRDGIGAWRLDENPLESGDGRS